MVEKILREQSGKGDEDVRNYFFERTHQRVDIRRKHERNPFL